MLCEPLELRHLEELHAIFVEPGVKKFLWDGETILRSQTEAVLVENEKLFGTKGFGLWGVRRHDADRLIGFVGFWYFRDPPELELLYGLSEAYWADGLATEIAKAIIAFGFEYLKFETIDASTDAPNRASVRVLEKCGMRQTRRETIQGLDTLFFSITSDT